jgi:ABC-type branched-subunit amino acid transport system ATPase component
MLLAQDPKLLLVDEPVAGMTDAETERPRSLLKEIAKTRSVVVVEHDMSFVRALGVKVTCLHEGSVLSEGTLDQSAPIRASSKCIWGDEHAERPQGRRSPLRRRPGAARRIAGCGHDGSALPACSAATALARPACSAPSPASQIDLGGISFDGKPLEGKPAHERARGGIGLVPQGREIFPLLTVEGKPRDRLMRRSKGRAQHSGSCVRIVPGAEIHAQPARRRSLGRAAAAAGHRPRAGHAAKALVLDEPTEGIQPSIIKDIGRAIAIPARQRGT